MRTRLAVAGVGVLCGLFGCFELLSLGWDNLLGTVVWLVGGVLVHDGVVAFATIALVWAATRTVSRRLRAAAAGAFVVLGTLTLVAVPVLGRFGARPDNPTLLDRNYVAGWLVAASLVCTGSAAAVLWKQWRPRASEYEG